MQELVTIQGENPLHILVLVVKFFISQLFTSAHCPHTLYIIQSPVTLLSFPFSFFTSSLILDIQYLNLVHNLIPSSVRYDAQFYFFGGNRTIH